MTKIRILSDIHSEFFRPLITGGNGGFVLTPAGEDVIVLAGDIGIETDGARWALAQDTGDIPMVMVAGNHEFYQSGGHHQTIESAYADLAKVAADSKGKLTFLQNDAVVIAGVRFIGCTFWTDFCLYGVQNRYGSMRAAQRGMNDYNLIYTEGGRARPEFMAAQHEHSLVFIEEALNESFDGPTVVVTHMAPSPQSIHEGFRDSTLNPAYSSNHEDLILKYQPALWIHGHTHTQFNYKIGETLVICNPLGYIGYDVNPEFDHTLIIEV